MELIYQDAHMVVCIKPAGVRSTDEPGGVPELVRQALGDEKATVRTVHRLDQVVSGLMVLARTEAAASELSRQIREHIFQKEYQAVIHGAPAEDSGTLRDLLYRDKARRMTMVAREMAKGVQEAVLDYRVTARQDTMSRVSIRLHTGRTHQIRVQFASRQMPLYGDSRYGGRKGDALGLWSHRLTLPHPVTGESLSAESRPDWSIAPWCYFKPL